MAIGIEREMEATRAEALDELITTSAQGAGEALATEIPGPALPTRSLNEMEVQLVAACAWKTHQLRDELRNRVRSALHLRAPTRAAVAKQIVDRPHRGWQPVES